MNVYLEATKRRTGERVSGVAYDDGLRSLWAVVQNDGSTAWVSSADTIHTWEPQTAGGSDD